MKLIRHVLLAMTVVLSGCTDISRSIDVYSRNDPLPKVFLYSDGGSSLFYSFTVGDQATATTDTVIFFYGGTGCTSWKTVMPRYVSGMRKGARIFVLNKRFVGDRQIGLLDCGTAFNLVNNPDQWNADYRAFISAQLSLLEHRPKNVVLVGVSEGALIAASVVKSLPQVTHLAIIGSGGFSLRQSLTTLAQRKAIWFDMESGSREIAKDPRSIEKSWYGNPYRWWSDVLDIAPLKVLLDLNIPIFVGIGEADASCPVESVRYLEDEFVKSGHRNLTVKIYPGANHRLEATGASYRQNFFAELADRLD